MKSAVEKYNCAATPTELNMNTTAKFNSVGVAQKRARGDLRISSAVIQVEPLRGFEICGTSGGYQAVVRRLSSDKSESNVI